jgi:hypothetical protein
MLKKIKNKIFYNLPLVALTVITGVSLFGIYLISAHPRDIGQTPPLTNFNPYYVNVNVNGSFQLQMPDLDNCPGGPYANICYDALGIITASCGNTQQDDTTFDLKGNACDLCGNGVRDSGEQCDWGMSPNCTSQQKICDKDLSLSCQSDENCIVDGTNRGPCKNKCNGNYCAMLSSSCSYCDYSCKLRTLTFLNKREDDFLNGCSDTFDNDGDGLANCQDPDCAGQLGPDSKICCLAEVSYCDNINVNGVIDSDEKTIGNRCWQEEFTIPNADFELFDDNNSLHNAACPAGQDCPLSWGLDLGGAIGDSSAGELTSATTNKYHGN